MKVLFISRGNSKGEISPIIQNQGLSLIDKGLDISYFTINGKGVKGYFKSLKQLFHLRNKYDIFHAHYSFTAIVSSLSLCKPLVVSLMGSEAHSTFIVKYVIKFFSKYVWTETIVKSQAMSCLLKLSQISIIPNGVNLNRFKQVESHIAKDILGWNKNKKHILFASDPARYEKNYPLAEAAVKLIDLVDIEIHFIKNIPNENLYLYFSACDVLLLTSLWEGSPNVIKEGMACNALIVSTDVGDVKELFGNTKGLQVVNYSPQNIAKAIDFAISTGGSSEGRARIVNLGMSSEDIANRIISVYNKVLKRDTES